MRSRLLLRNPARLRHPAVTDEQVAGARPMLVTLAPGISRELDLLFDHTRAGHARFTLMSVKLEHPVLSWLQFGVEMPVLILDPGGPRWPSSC